MLIRINEQDRERVEGFLLQKNIEYSFYNDSIHSIINLVGMLNHLPLNWNLTKTRERPYAYAKKVCICVLRILTDTPLIQIGQLFRTNSKDGYMDHSSVYVASWSVFDLINLHDQVNYIINVLRPENNLRSIFDFEPGEYCLLYNENILQIMNRERIGHKDNYKIIAQEMKTLTRKEFIGNLKIFQAYSYDKPTTFDPARINTF